MAPEIHYSERKMKIRKKVLFWLTDPLVSGAALKSDFAQAM
jgi:hypothetical protein